MVDKMITKIVCGIVEQQDNLIMAKVVEIGGERYQEITLDKNKVIDAFRKATPTEPIGDLHSVPHFRCPTCEKSVKTYTDSPGMPYCGWCGQKLDWDAALE